MSRILSFALASFTTIMIAGGQTVTQTGTGTQNLKSLSLESIIPFDSIDAVIVPSIPADVLASISSGAMELHQQTVYDANAKTLKVNGLLELAGSAVPTPSGAAGVTPVWSYTVAVDRVEITSKPSNAVVFVGSVSAGSSTTPFGDISGSLVTVSAGYKTPVDPAAASNTVFSGISTNIAGAASLFSKAGSGTIGLGTTGASGMPTAVAGPKNLISPTPQFQLDASKSTDSNGGTLTYHWAYVPVFGMTATITGADTATPTVTVPDYSDAQGDYTFQLTVTNAAGLSSTDTVVVTYSVN